MILFRIAAMGDVICTLPMCGEIRKRHPGRLLIYVTLHNYRRMLLLSRAADCIYGVSWNYGTPWGYPHHFWRLVEKVYIPQTFDERSRNVGSQSHLVDELAASCGIAIPNSDRQPHLFPSSELIKIVQAKYGLAKDVAEGRLIIGINCGQVWPVRMWDAAKWQALVDMIHAEYHAAILQLGFRKGDADEYDHIRGVQYILRMLMDNDELVALVANCRLMISVDSGPVHLAGAVGVPVVGLYGPVNPLYRLPPASPSMGVASDVPCLFCQHRTPIEHWKTGCPYDIRCMKLLDVQLVFQAVRAMLSKSGKTSCGSFGNSPHF